MQATQDKMSKDDDFIFCELLVQTANKCTMVD